MCALMDFTNVNTSSNVSSGTPQTQGPTTILSSATGLIVEWPISPFSRTESTLLGTLLGTAAGLGTLGNILLLYLIYRFRTLRTRFSSLLISMSCSDIFMSSFALLVATSTFKGQWMYGKVGCDLYGFLSTMTVLVSIGCLVSISIWRYLSVYRLQYRCNIYKISKKAIFINLLAIWLPSVFLAFCPLVGWSRYILESNMVSCTFDYLSDSWLSKSYALVLIVYGYILPATSMIYCYSMLTCLVSRYRNQLSLQLHRDAVTLRVANHNKNIKKQLKMSYIGGLCIGLFLTSWTPYGVIAVFTIFNRGKNIPPIVITLACFTAKLITFINPIVYAFCHDTYRNKLCLLFKRKIAKNTSLLENGVLQNNTLLSQQQSASPQNRLEFNEEIPIAMDLSNYEA